MAKRAPAAQTAFGPMVVVAIEQTYPPPRRVVQDEAAVRLLPASAGPLVAACRWPLARNAMIGLSERRAPGVWGGVLGRKRYADEKVSAAIESGIEQLVVLGAGLDTRAYRFAETGRVSAFELDLPENSAYKRERIAAAFGRVPEHLSLLSINFDTDELGDVLGAHGFRMDRPTMFVWEAVTQYLTEAGVRNTLTVISRAAVGSQLTFTFIRKDFLEGTNLYDARNLYRDFVVRQRLWQFGLNPSDVAALLGEYGWREQQQYGAAEFTREYLRPVGRDLAVTEIERSVHADKP